MSTQWWVVIIAVLIVVAIFFYLRSRRTEVNRAQDLRMDAQQQRQAQSPAEEISQREEHRLSRMSEEDRAWETASLERNRELEERSHNANPND